MRDDGRFGRLLFPAQILLVMMCGAIIGAPADAMKFLDNVFVTNGAGTVVGHTAKMTLSSGTGSGIIPELQALGTILDDSSLGLLRTSADTGGSAIVLSKSRNGTLGSFGIVVSGDTLGQVIWAGDDGADYRATAARIDGAVDGTPGVGDMPGRLVFLTSADGAENPAERMRVNSVGNLGVGATAMQGFRLRVQATDATALDATRIQSGTETNTIAGLRIHNTDTTTANSGAAINFQLGSTNTADAAIAALRTSNDNSALLFFTEAANAFAERMRLDEAGELLLNSTTDQGNYTLQVSGATYLGGNVTTTGGRTINAAVKTNSDTPYALVAADHQILLDGTSGNVTVNMPAPTVGREVWIARHNSGANTLTLDPVDSPAVTINGSSANKNLGAAIGYTVRCIGATTTEWNCAGISPL